ncbi:hypothetical protein [Flavivirga eckloniae]|uniref:Uncharacterized protein n=1 Tax=Flavivirga eckloniae TaxID=1803846 RepID=A0A2K9PKR9_9FLAO|nr:hypothetical protein [Flavivirga eckloniae]AUP77669.1 hypothetical protein C1H87_02635 [Flavivirga eckloniae]
MKQLLFFLFLFSTSCVLKAQESTIASSDAAYDHFNLIESYSILESILTVDTIQDEQKCKALRRLAHQDWKYYQNYDLAKERLQKADTIGSKKYETWMLLSRIERASQHFNDALYAAINAKEFAQSENEVNKANTEYANAVYTSSMHQLTKSGSVDTSLLMKTTTLLSKVLETDAGLPLPSKLLLGIALLNNDGDNVIKAWQSYFQIQDIQQVSPYLKDPAKKLNQICKNWNGNTLSVSNQEVLIDALSSSRFYEFIPVYVKKNCDESCYTPKTRDAITYSQYLNEVEKETNEYYRLIAIAQENETAYIEWLNNKRKELWNKLSFTAQNEYSEEDFLKETEEHFGARGFTGGTGNYSGYVLALGHIVNQEKAKVEQYGYQPEFTYTQIDMMVSNGFSSWFWEHKAIGGWATDNEIIRVREVYLSGPINAWKTATDSVERRKTEKIINEFLDNSTENQLETAKGLAAKLRFDAINDLYNGLVSKDLSGKALKLAFLSKYEQYRMEASMLAHEGRHSIDQKYMPEEFEGWSNEIREFRGKLSQIIFAPEPRLELSGMVTSIIGDYGHIKANKRIVDVAIEWIKENKEHISGYSDNKSAFSQLYLLTNNQIKECYKQVDPLNK